MTASVIVSERFTDLCERTCSSVSWSNAGLPRCVDGASVEPSLDCARVSCCQTASSPHQAIQQACATLSHC